MDKVLKFIKNEMKTLKIDYEFMEWTKPLIFPFFVGELNGLENPYEDGKNEYQFSLTGTDTGSVTNLINVNKALKNKYQYGYKAIVNNSAIVITYSNFFFIPQQDEDLKRIQINLKINLWEN